MDERLDFPASIRNRDPILEVLRSRLPDSEARVLEIASGSGQHVAYFAAHWPELRFVPSDPEPAHRASIAAWCRDLDNVEAPIDIDARIGPWPGDFDVVYCANMIHIAPIECTRGLLINAASVVAPGGRLLLYGPFLQTGVTVAPSNVEFDASLRRRDPSWGIRHLDDEVTPTADAAGWMRADVVSMPANNLFVEFVRTTRPSRP